MLIYCPECNHEISNTALWCPACGKPLFHQREKLAHRLLPWKRSQSEGDLKSYEKGLIDGREVAAAHVARSLRQADIPEAKICLVLGMDADTVRRLFTSKLDDALRYEKGFQEGIHQVRRQAIDTLRGDGKPQDLVQEMLGLTFHQYMHP